MILVCLPWKMKTTESTKKFEGKVYKELNINLIKAQSYTVKSWFSTRYSQTFLKGFGFTMYRDTLCSPTYYSI